MKIFGSQSHNLSKQYCRQVPMKSSSLIRNQRRPSCSSYHYQENNNFLTEQARKSSQNVVSCQDTKNREAISNSNPNQIDSSEKQNKYYPYALPRHKISYPKKQESQSHVSSSVLDLDVDSDFDFEKRVQDIEIPKNRQTKIENLHDLQNNNLDMDGVVLPESLIENIPNLFPEKESDDEFQSRNNFSIEKPCRSTVANSQSKSKTAEKNKIGASNSKISSSGSKIRWLDQISSVMVNENPPKNSNLTNAGKNLVDFDDGLRDISNILENDPRITNKQEPSTSGNSQQISRKSSLKIKPKSQTKKGNFENIDPSLSAFMKSGSKFDKSCNENKYLKKLRSFDRKNSVQLIGSIENQNRNGNEKAYQNSGNKLKYKRNSYCSSSCYQQKSKQNNNLTQNQIQVQNSNQKGSKKKYQNKENQQNFFLMKGSIQQQKSQSADKNLNMPKSINSISRKSSKKDLKKIGVNEHSSSKQKLKVYLDSCSTFQEKYPLKEQTSVENKQKIIKNKEKKDQKPLSNFLDLSLEITSVELNPHKSKVKIQNEVEISKNPTSRQNKSQASASVIVENYEKRSIINERKNSCGKIGGIRKNSKSLIFEQKSHEQKWKNAFQSKQDSSFENKIKENHLDKVFSEKSSKLKQRCFQLQKRLNETFEQEYSYSFEGGSFLQDQKKRKDHAFGEDRRQRKNNPPIDKKEEVQINLAPSFQNSGQQSSKDKYSQFTKYSENSDLNFGKLNGKEGQNQNIPSTCDSQLNLKFSSIIQGSKIYEDSIIDLPMTMNENQKKISFNKNHEKEGQEKIKKQNRIGGIRKNSQTKPPRLQIESSNRNLLLEIEKQIKTQKQKAQIQLKNDEIPAQVRLHPNSINSQSNPNSRTKVNNKHIDNYIIYEEQQELNASIEDFHQKENSKKNKFDYNNSQSHFFEKEKQSIIKSYQDSGRQKSTSGISTSIVNLNINKNPYIDTDQIDELDNYEIIDQSQISGHFQNHSYQRQRSIKQQEPPSEIATKQKYGKLSKLDSLNERLENHILAMKMKQSKNEENENSSAARMAVYLQLEKSYSFSNQ